jgi:hypothetical protein
VPVRFGLELAVRSRRARIAIIDECDIMPNENALFDCDAFADEGVARDFATRPDRCAFLDFNESANFRFVADFAPIKVYESADPNIASELYVGRYKLMSHSLSSHATTISAGGTTRRPWSPLRLRVILSRCRSIKHTSKAGSSAFLFLLLLTLVRTGVLEYERENE